MSWRLWPPGWHSNSWTERIRGRNIRDGLFSPLSGISSIGRHLDFTSANSTRYMTITKEFILIFHLRGHGQLSYVLIETSHGAWLWLSWTQHWQMGTSPKAINLFQLCSYAVNLRMIWWRTPLGWTLWILGGPGGQHARQLFSLQAS